MNIYVWSRLQNVTISYHSEGGLAIIASSLEEAHDIYRQDCGEDLPDHCDVFITDPDWVIPLSATAELPQTRILVFPDAGCC